MKKEKCIKCGRRYKRLTDKNECYYCNPKEHRKRYFVIRNKIK